MSGWPKPPRPFLPWVVDWTDFDSSGGILSGEAGALQVWFRVMGLPTVLFLDSTGEEVRVFGDLDTEDFVARSQMAANSG